MQTVQLLKDLSTGQENILILMAVPFFFLGIVIPSFVLWLKRSRKPNSPNTESE